ncbi:MAG: amino acid permease, partial [Bacteroidales bacterium]
NAVHVQDLKDPAKDYTKSLFIAAIAIVSIFVLATLAIGVIVPEKDINLTQSLLVAYRDLWGVLGMDWMGNVMAVMLAFGVIGQVMVIIAGPSTGLLAVGRAGYLPKGLQKVNKQQVQAPILMVQGALVTLLTFVMVLLPSVQSAYQILGQLATIIYMICIITVYIAAIRLRYTAPNKKRPFKIPGGNWGIWLLSIIGIAGAGLAGIVSFIPPSQITTGSPVVYVGILIIGAALFAALPFVVEAFGKKSWKDPKSTFEPFDWELEGRKPSQVSKLAVGQDAGDLAKNTSEKVNG